MCNCASLLLRCVDMCPKPNVTIHELSRMSHREPLEGSIPTLFQVWIRRLIFLFGISTAEPTFFR